MPRGVSPVITIGVSEDQLRCFIYILSKERAAYELIELTEEEKKMYYTELYNDFEQEIWQERIWFTVVPEKEEEL
jgi:hypothetical protein